ncbi:MAG: LuxR C-terminal-related transcriptional regulator [Chloroflexota bacterium]
MTSAIAEIAPETKVLALGLTDDKKRVLRYVEAGATGYVLKDDSLDVLLNTIRASQQGKAYVSPEIAAAMMKRLSDLAQLFSDIENSVTEDAGLTSRELEVLELIGQNLTNQQIAEHLTIEVGTVTSFFTPIGHHGNLLIYGPGRYQFSDFLRVGIPLTLLAAGLVAILAPMLWPAQ